MVLVICVSQKQSSEALNLHCCLTDPAVVTEAAKEATKYVNPRRSGDARNLEEALMASECSQMIRNSSPCYQGTHRESPPGLEAGCSMARLSTSVPVRNLRLTACRPSSASSLFSFSCLYVVGGSFFGCFFGGFIIVLGKSRLCCCAHCAVWCGVASPRPGDHPLPGAEADGRVRDSRCGGTPRPFVLPAALCPSLYPCL